MCHERFPNANSRGAHIYIPLPSPINIASLKVRFVRVIRRFQKALIEYGLTDVDVFQTVDLWEKKDIAQVITTLFALGREVSVLYTIR